MRLSSISFYWLFIIVGLSLYASWLLPEGRIYWDKIDQNTFFLLNGIIAENRTVQLIWSVANHRAFDLVSATIFGVVYWRFLRKNKHSLSPSYVVAHGIFMALYAVIVIQLVHLIFSEGRLSPSLVLEPSYKLSELIPWITAKDASSRSFPGDHATVLLLFSVFMHAFCGKSYKILYLLVIIFTLPRLVSGAHWLTDVVIGGGATVCIVASIALLLDLPKRFSSAVSRYIQPIVRRLGVE